MVVVERGKMAYGKLLIRILPQVITSDEENERVIAELEKLDTRRRPLTPEEERVAALLTLLIRQYEESRYPLGHAEPVEALCIDGSARSAKRKSASSLISSTCPLVYFSDRRSVSAPTNPHVTQTCPLRIRLK